MQLQINKATGVTKNQDPKFAQHLEKLREIEKSPEIRKVVEKVSKDPLFQGKWKYAKKGTGLRIRPNKDDGIRVMKGQGNQAKNSSQVKPYVQVRSGGNVIDKQGNILQQKGKDLYRIDSKTKKIIERIPNGGDPGDHPDAHINWQEFLE